MLTEYTRDRIPKTVEVYRLMKKAGYDSGADYIWKELQKYILSDYKPTGDFVPSDEPAGMFIFGRTPQGVEYWWEVQKNIFPDGAIK